jgi:hypothetical protein
MTAPLRTRRCRRARRLRHTPHRLAEARVRVVMEAMRPPRMVASLREQSSRRRLLRMRLLRRALTLSRL